MARHRVTVLSVDGAKTVDVVDTAPTLETLQAHVGGYIERVAMPESFAGDLWVNEEGLNEELPFNAAASRLAQDAWVAVVPRERLDFGMLQLHGPAVLVEEIA